MDNLDAQNDYELHKEQKEQRVGIKRIPSITDQVLYVDQNTNKESDGLKLSTTSWASQIEEEMGNSITDEQLTGSNNASSWKDARSKNNDQVPVYEKKNIDIDKLINENIETQDDVDLLNNQTIIINSLRKTIKNYVDKYLQNKEQPAFDFSKSLNKLEWLLAVSKYFSDKLHTPIILHTTKGRNIPRSSYKFCDYGHDCEYNYTHKHEGCFAQHFVHNFVYADIKALADHIQIVKKKEFDDIKFIEIMRCMNTVSYVISHMHEELKCVSHYHDNYLDLHLERTPNGKNKKKTTNKNFNKKQAKINTKKN